MRHLTRGIAVLAVASVALATVGCNKGSAEAALKAADQAVETAKPELERYTPDAVAPLVTALGNARTLFDRGHYTDALKAARELPANVEAALAAAKEKKADLTVAWAEISGSLPKIVQALTARVGDIAGMKSLPKGMDKAGVETAKSELGAITEAWRAATDAFAGGDVPRALATARGVKAKAEALAEALGLDLAGVAPAGADPVM